MAIQTGGPGGSYSGKIGPYEGYVLHGRQIIRSVKEKSTKPPSVKQLANRQKLSIASNFASYIKEFLNIGFHNMSLGQFFIPVNAATGLIAKNGIIGEYPDQQIDFSKILVSSGTLIPAINPIVTVEEDHLYFSWDKGDNSGNWNDHVMLLVVEQFPDKNKYELCGAKRSAEKETLYLDPIFKSHMIEVYISFRAETEIKCSDSTYLGKIQF